MKSFKHVGVYPLALSILFASLLATGCTNKTKNTESKTLTLQATESFVLTKSVIDKFEHDTGISVKIVASGQPGGNLNMAILTKGKPAADVMWGIDNTLLSKAVKSGAFTSYSPARLSAVAGDYVTDSTHQLTPVDHAAVCVDYDKDALAKKGLAAPQALEDLAKPEYKNLLVTENPNTESTGLAFLLATISHFGPTASDGSQAQDSSWKHYWQQLIANNVLIVSGWQQAYNTEFSAGPGHGQRPIVVSYATDPAADVIASGSTGVTARSSIGVATNTCFGQQEFAGILKGSKHLNAAKKFIDFLLSTEVQDDLPGQMYVYPVVKDATLPDAFARFAQPVKAPISLDPATIDAYRTRWTQQWSDITKH